jgi:hypothetical protein
VTALAGAGLTACGGGQSGCKAGLLPGDLALSEIMADPAGTDEGKEWFEIYNASGQALELEGLTVISSRADGTSEVKFKMGPARIQPGQYFVLGGMVPALKKPWVDYPYGSALGALRNENGRLALRCDETLVDQATYGKMTQGASMVFDGNQVPDAIANDTPTKWCDSKNEYETGSRGSPGAPNDKCEPVLPPGQCMEGENIRNTRPPAAGSLVITEFLADPQAVGDTVGEWIELYASDSFDLNGLELGKFPPVIAQTVSSVTCLPAEAGSYVVLARSADPTMNGGLPRVDAVMTMSLSNSGAQGIFVGYRGEVLDAITYSTSGAGASTSLDPTKRNAVDNDDPANWCRTPAGTTYGAGDRGTPGAANPSCGIVTPGRCLENDAERAKVAPQAGDLVINEFMANPRAVSDTDGEWFEVFVARDVDLNGLQVGRVPGVVDLTLPEGECRRAVAGTHLLFARKADPLVNGGLPQVDVLIGFSLVNTGGSLFVGLDGVVLDGITWASSGDGVATSLNPDFQNPLDNDQASSWCPAATEYGQGTPPDKGTPGAVNPACP